LNRTDGIVDPVGEACNVKRGTFLYVIKLKNIYREKYCEGKVKGATREGCEKNLKWNADKTVQVSFNK